MSYDVYVNATARTTVYERNVTYNNSPIFHEALGCSFGELDGKKVKDVLSFLKSAIDDIHQNRPKYELLSPGNGWGGVDDCLEILIGIVDTCQEFPDVEISVVY